MRRAFQLVLAGSLAIALGGCSSDPREGYSFGSTYDTNIKTIALPMWGNNTYLYGLEAELTAAIHAEIQRTTPWKVVDASSAQTTLSGTITSSDMKKLSTSRTSGLAEDLAVTMTVDFVWKDNRTGKPIVSRRGYSVAQSFVPATGALERVEVGQNAAVQQLAKDIVADLRSGW